MIPRSYAVSTTEMVGLRMPAMPDAGPEERIERIVDTARAVLGMDMGYVAEITDDLQIYRTVTGAPESFGTCRGDSVDVMGSYCRLMLAGEIGNIVPDTSREPLVAELSLTREGQISSYIGVPIILPHGEVFGSFCCVSHEPMPQLDERQVELMRMLAGLIGDQIEYERMRVAVHAAEILDGTVGALIASLEVRDGYTEEHSLAVVELAVAIAERLGMSATQVDDLRIVAVLHDIGKLGVPDTLLHKPETLNSEEWTQMRRHSEIGADLVASMRPISHLSPIIRAEHERWDGGGYPDGLAGEEIPVAARIVLIADAFHAMTSDRPYRSAMSSESALVELERNSGSQFWPDAVDAAVSVLAAA